MNQAIQDFISGKRIAVIGASRGGKKFGNAAAKELAARGYQVVLVHPSAERIDDFQCYPSLDAVRDKVDGVFVCVPSLQAETVLRRAAELGLRNVWLQQGAETPELIALGKELDLNLVAGKCVLMYAPPVRSFHGWHRGLMRLVGQL